MHTETAATTTTTTPALSVRLADDGGDPVEVEGIGSTFLEALDDCADEVEAIENPGEESDSEDDEDPLLWPAQTCPKCEGPVSGEAVHREGQFYHHECLGLPAPAAVDDSGDDDGCPF